MADASTYTLLQRVTVTSPTSSVTFSNIPQSGYTDLQVVMSARTTTNGDSYGEVDLSFNGAPSGTAYSWRRLLGNGVTTGSTSGSNDDAINLFAPITGSGATASTFSNVSIYVPNYTSSNNKSVSVDAVTENNTTQAVATLYAGLWASSSAINSIVLTVTYGTAFAQYSTFSLYGVSALGTTPGAPKALGGDIVKTDGSYWYHTFLGSGLFVPQSAITCDYLVVAGGAGGAYLSGGGGAGGYRTASSQSLTAQAYPVIVGAGGTGTFNQYAGNGTNSSFNSTTSTGGGNGGFEDGTTLSGLGGVAGGSGGGAPVAESSTAYGAGNAGGYSPVEGYRGGGATGDRNYGNGAGGGGGSSGVGANGTTSSGGAGGAGTANSISGTSVTYAIGGSGAFNNASGGGAGANGNGGGTSSTAFAGESGLPGTGNGGGGAGNSAAFGGAGGSGVVIIKYAV
jgi:hypothetical protein